MADRSSVAVGLRSTLRLLPRFMDAPRQEVVSTSFNLSSDTSLVEENASTVMPAPRLAAPAGLHYIDSENVLLLNVSLPKMAGSQRKAAVAFAVEDLIAQPLEQVHVVLGPEISGTVNAGSWLVAVVSSTVMADTIAANPEMTGALVPDVLALQVPDPGDWSVLSQNGRILVRLPDHSGFASTPAMLPVLWAAGGSPRLVLLGGALPADMPVAARAQLAAAPDAKQLAIDLRSGRFARSGVGWPVGTRRLAIVLALAVFGHLALLGLDVIGLGRIAATKDAALRTALEAKGQPSTGDLDAALTAALASSQPASSSDFLPFLALAFGAIAEQTGQVQIKDLRFIEAQHTLTMTVEASDLAALQTVETALVEVGLKVDTGAATTADGAADAQMTVRRAEQ